MHFPTGRIGRVQRQGRAAPEADKAGLLDGYASSGSDEYAGFLSNPRPRRSFGRAAALTLLSLLTVVAAGAMLSFKGGANDRFFSGRMELVSVSVITRHGARAAINRQTWEDADRWPEGYGELTVNGMQQAYAVGQQLRSRYVDLLHLLPREAAGAAGRIRARATAFDRTQDTAFALLMGLLSSDGKALPRPAETCPCRGDRPTSNLTESKASTPTCLASCMGITDPLLPQYVPQLEVSPKEDDWLLRQWAVCDGYEQPPQHTEQWDSAEATYTQAAQSARTFLGEDRLCEEVMGPDGQVTEETCNGPPLGLRDLAALYDNLMCAEFSGKPCPNGANCRELLADLHPVNEFLWNYDFKGANAVEAGGMLLGEILETMKTARRWHAPPESQPRDSAAPPPALYLYSAHDTNVAALLGAMNAPWFHAPRFASHVVIELWAPRGGDLSNEELWFVSVTYDGRKLTSLPGCDSGSCRFKDFFYALYWTQARYEEDCRRRT